MSYQIQPPTGPELAPMEDDDPEWLPDIVAKRQGRSNSPYEQGAEEIEESMYERCQESLKDVRDRKIARMRFGAAKRAVEAVGKRLNAEAARG